MINFIQQSLEELTLTSTSLTLGYGAGQQEPPRVLVLWPASTATVTLPPINTIIPTSPGANFTPGSQAMLITIKSLTGQVVNLSAANTNETFAGSTVVISSTNAVATLVASTTDSKWYNL